MDEQPAMPTPSATSASKDDLQCFVQSLYPNLLTATYCVPPCIMNRVPYSRESFAGQPLRVTQPLNEARTKPMKKSDTPKQKPSPQKRPHSPESESQVEQKTKMLSPAPPQNILNEETLYSSTPMTVCSDTPQATASTSQHQPNPYPDTMSSGTYHGVWKDEPQPYDKPTTVQGSDIQSDFAQQHVLHCLKALGENQQEPMFIISELKFPDYLRWISHLDNVQFPLPRDMPDKHDRDGDFDILIVHRQYGVLVGEIKSQGLKFDDEKMKTQWPLAAAGMDKRVFDREVKIHDAAQQLGKMERVLQRIASDFAPGLNVRKTIILPYVKRKQLEQMLREKDENIRECMAGPGVDASEAAQLCLTADDLSDRTAPREVNGDILSKLQLWFQKRMASSPDPVMTDDVYLKLVARLVGPATSVKVHCTSRPRLCMEVRTKSEAISHIGELLAELVLTPTQLQLLRNELPLVCLVGPPGTGKTIVLVLMGLEWLLQGHDVYVLSCNGFCLAVSVLIQYQLEKTLRAYPANRKVGRIHIQEMNLYGNDKEVDRAVEKLKEAATNDGVYILMDEAHFNASRDQSIRCCDLISKLSREIEQGLHLWAATGHVRNVPRQLMSVELAVPLRSAQAVIEEVSPGINSMNGMIPQYTAGGIPSPADGLEVVRLYHKGDGHTAGTAGPVECFKCGKDVAIELRKLHVGVNDPMWNLNTSGKRPPVRPSPLQYRDVMVLSRSEQLRPECEFVRGLSSSITVDGVQHTGIPVHVDRTEAWTKLSEFDRQIVIPENDTVTVAKVTAVRSLERKVIVCLPGRVQGHDDRKTNRELEMMDRLWAASRCSTQLIMVTVPE